MSLSSGNSEKCYLEHKDVQFTDTYDKEKHEIFTSVQMETVIIDIYAAGSELLLTFTAVFLGRHCNCCESELPSAAAPTDGPRYRAIFQTHRWWFILPLKKKTSESSPDQQTVPQTNETSPEPPLKGLG